MTPATGSREGVPLSLHRVDRLEDAREEWDRLAEGAGHPFATWEWISTWWHHCGGGSELYTFVCRDPQGQVVAILPLYVAMRRPVRVARFLGYGPIQTPLCMPEHRKLAAAAINDAIGPGRDRCRLLLAERIPGEQEWGDLLGGRLIATDDDPVLSLNGISWEEFLASRSRNFRSGVGRKERKLQREHGLNFRLCDDPARLQEDMSILFALHEKRWGDRSTGVFRGARAELHREFAAQALERGWLRLWIAEVDGEPAAAYHGLRYAGSEWFFQSGRDPRFERLSVGGVLLAKVIREACEAGTEDFRFLLGDEAYKFRFADGDYRPQTRLLGSGATAAAGALALRAFRSVPHSVRGPAVRILRRRS